MIPGDLTFTIGQSWEPTDWYYAQTNRGVWTIRFPLDHAYDGTAYLTVATSMQQTNTVLGGPPGPGVPVVAVNGSTAALSGALPTNNDSTIARQADRSGYPRTVVLTFPANLLVAGENEITFTHGAATAAGTGLGWDTLVLEVDEAVVPRPARLSVKVTKTGAQAGTQRWSVAIRNVGDAVAHDVRITSVTNRKGRPVQIADRDPNRFPTPVAGLIEPGASVSVEITAPSGQPLAVLVGSDGGRTVAQGHS